MHDVVTGGSYLTEGHLASLDGNQASDPNIDKFK